MLRESRELHSYHSSAASAFSCFSVRLLYPRKEEEETFPCCWNLLEAPYTKAHAIKEPPRRRKEESTVKKKMHAVHEGKNEVRKSR
jgi:hypothetical protein